VLDLDAFKKINDTLGHAVGDQVLQTIALRLKGCVRAADQVIRMGGDEFVIILPDLLEVSEVKSLAERILASFEAPVAISGKEIQTSCSLGVAVAFGNGETAEALEQILSKADAAMYLAKSQGRNCIAWGEDLPVMVGA
jgi:diguanylate cyclase (GGDEF)-like protein